MSLSQLIARENPRPEGSEGREQNSNGNRFPFEFLKLNNDPAGILTDELGIRKSEIIFGYKVNRAEGKVLKEGKHAREVDFIPLALAYRYDMYDGKNKKWAVMTPIFNDLSKAKYVEDTITGDTVEVLKEKKLPLKFHNFVVGLVNFGDGWEPAVIDLTGISYKSFYDQLEEDFGVFRQSLPLKKLRLGTRKHVTQTGVPIYVWDVKKVDELDEEAVAEIEDLGMKVLDQWKEYRESTLKK
jgi:hypothetical protein